MSPLIWFKKESWVLLTSMLLWVKVWDRAMLFLDPLKLFIWRPKVANHLFLAKSRLLLVLFFEGIEKSAEHLGEAWKTSN